MPQPNRPTILMTRPKAASDDFVRALQAKAGAFEAIVCPAFEFASTDALIPIFDIAVFTSRTGVLFAPRGDGRPAYCVGDATAKAAKQSGYDAKSATGAAEDLLRLILRQNPRSKLLHIRGETSVGNITGTLVKSGMDASEVVAYRKVVTEKSRLQKAIHGLGPDVVLPLFSAETVTILAESGANFSNMKAVAISPAVAQAVAKHSLKTITTAAAPNQAEMVAAVVRLIA